jgi:hypothetical protein
MASGKLASSNITALNNDNQLYQVPASHITSFSVNFCNRGAVDVKVRLAICATSTPALGEWLEWDSVIPANETLQRLGLLASAGQYVFVRSDTANVSATMWGIEELTS